VQNRERVPDGWEITLTDFSPGMLAAAQKNLRDAGRPYHFHQVDAQQIPYESRNFDAVIANHMLYHVPDRARALSEIKRVMKRNRSLYATTTGEQHMVEMWALVAPFYPHLLERRTRAAITFTLENGADQLYKYFDTVERVDYEDSLKITDAEAVVAYLRSSTTLMDFTLTDAMVAYIRKTIHTAIAEYGTFHVTKASGLFIAY
jgi:ubiquinone/menaquinone biosynthesis C-methylase UbiE